MEYVIAIALLIPYVMGFLFTWGFMKQVADKNERAISPGMWFCILFNPLFWVVMLLWVLAEAFANGPKLIFKLGKAVAEKYGA